MKTVNCSTVYILKNFNQLPSYFFQSKIKYNVVRQLNAISEMKEKNARK